MRPRTSRRWSSGSGSAESRDVTGRVFEVAGGMISLADGWRTGPEVDKGARWDARRGRRRRTAPSTT